jgi:hypothetical protein
MTTDSIIPATAREFLKHDKPHHALGAVALIVAAIVLVAFAPAITIWSVRALL